MPKDSRSREYHGKFGARNRSAQARLYHQRFPFFMPRSGAGTSTFLRVKGKKMMIGLLSLR